MIIYAPYSYLPATIGKGIVMTLYEEKEKFFKEYRYAEDAGCCPFQQISADDFYRDLFPEGSFENCVGYQENYEKTNKGNGFIVYQTDDEKKHTRMVFDDLQEIKKYSQNYCSFMSPISYFGRRRTAANARLLFAMTFDLDNVGEPQLESFFGYHLFHKHYPVPTYIVNSGGGVHLYYVFENPIPMTPDNQKNLKKVKYALTSMMWNVDTSGLKDPQYQGLNQGFRLVGSRTKHGETVTVWKTGKRVTPQYLQSFLKDEYTINEFKLNETTMSLEEAKKKYPEWYQQRIVEGRKRMSWTCNRKLYEWWKSKAFKVKEHHRYFYIMSLTIYAIKCDVPYEELKKDAFDLQDIMNHNAPNNPFTDDDIYSALEMYQECYKSFPRDEIAHISALPITVNKRNGRKQSDHIKLMNFVRDEINGNVKWRNSEGRPSLKHVVLNYLEQNPTAKKCEVIRATSLNKRTVYKYYDECLSEIKQTK